MHVKGVVAPTPHRRAVVPRNVTIRTTRLKGRVANPAALIVHVPSPGGYAVPSMVGYVQGGRRERRGGGQSGWTGGASGQGDPGTRSPLFPALLNPILCLFLPTALGNAGPRTRRTF
jgi:hypothetical protein